MEEEGEELTPFWLQSSANPHGRRRRGASSILLNSGVFVFLLCVTAVLCIFFIVPSIVSVTSHFFWPGLVKKSWDSLNVVLVLFALLFGFLSRNTNREHDSGFDGHHQSVSNTGNEDQKGSSSSANPFQWYDYPDRTAYSSSNMRTSSSYPDLRGVSPWVAVDDRWRFSDDTQVDSYWEQAPCSDRLRRRPSWKRVEEDQSKTIHVDTLVTRAKEVSNIPPLAPVARRKSYQNVAETGQRAEQVTYESEPEPAKSLTSPSLLPSPPSPHLPPSPTTAPSPESFHRKPKQTFESVGHTGKRKVVNETEYTKIQPMPSPPEIYSDESGSKSERQRGGSSTTKDLKKKKPRAKSVDNFETLLQPQPPATKKKLRQKSVDNFETLIQLQTRHISPTPPSKPQPPPPPPPPQPPAAFFHLFPSKKGKTKKIISIPPPPPPPPIKASHASRTTREPPLIRAREAPLPVKISSFGSVEENSNSGGNSPLTGSESPLNPIPPPPPLPPFKMPGWKFEVQGDYVRVNSMNSSSSGSPDLDDVDSPRSEVSAGDSGEVVVAAAAAAPPLFCPSPDVDTKADMFIASFRAGLKLQKNNSIKQKQGLRFSKLGPETRPSKK